MAKIHRGRRRITSRKLRPSPYGLASAVHEDWCSKSCSKVVDKKDWEDATCSVCMECPHNAVLLLCSSHDKGCRPYMCGTSFRYSNCLDQYKKAYTKVISSNQGTTSLFSSSVENANDAHDSSLLSDDKCEVTKLACPLCRGQVKGWTTVEPAREYLNAKKRNCMQENCSFVGTYKELRKHMRADHPSAQPREVDPNLEQKWRRLEREHDRDDAISTIRSTMPGALVLGDYVIERNSFGGFDSDDDDVDGGGDNLNELSQTASLEAGFDNNILNVFLLLHAFRSGDDNGDRLRQSGTANHLAVEENAIENGQANELLDTNFDNSGNGGMSLINRLRRQGRVLLGRSARRRRHREASGDN